MTHPANEERIERAAMALCGYHDEPQADLGDLLADLRHWAAENDVDFSYAVELSEMHFECERGDGDDIEQSHRALREQENV